MDDRAAWLLISIVFWSIVLFIVVRLGLAIIFASYQPDIVPTRPNELQGGIFFITWVRREVLKYLV